MPEFYFFDLIGSRVKWEECQLRQQADLDLNLCQDTSDVRCQSDLSALSFSSALSTLGIIKPTPDCIFVSVMKCWHLIGMQAIVVAIIIIRINL